MHLQNKRQLYSHKLGCQCQLHHCYQNSYHSRLHPQEDVFQCHCQPRVSHNDSCPSDSSQCQDTQADGHGVQYTCHLHLLEPELNTTPGISTAKHRPRYERMIIKKYFQPANQWIWLHTSVMHVFSTMHYAHYSGVGITHRYQHRSHHLQHI